jgi:hypothetical protein
MKTDLNGQIGQKSSDAVTTTVPEAMGCSQASGRRSAELAGSPVSVSHPYERNSA